MAVIQIPESVKEKIISHLQNVKNANQILKTFISGVALGMGIERATFYEKDMTFVTEEKQEEPIK
jgi:hypothetical protein